MKIKRQYKGEIITPKSINLSHFGKFKLGETAVTPSEHRKEKLLKTMNFKDSMLSDATWLSGTGKMKRSRQQPSELQTHSGELASPFATSIEMVPTADFISQLENS